MDVDDSNYNKSSSSGSSDPFIPYGKNTHLGMGFLLIGAGVLIILLGGCLILIKTYYKHTNNVSVQQLPQKITQREPTQQTKLAWGVYTDKNNVFTLTYPSSLYVTESVDVPDIKTDISAGALSTVKPYNNGLDKESDMLIEMIIRTLPPNTSLEKYIDENVLTYQPEDTDLDGIVPSPIKAVPTVKKTVNLGGTDAIWIEGLAFMSVSHTEVFIPYKDNKIVTIKIYDGTGPQEFRNMKQYQENIRLAEQIVSSFRFVQNRGSKKYTNTKYGFSLNIDSVFSHSFTENVNSTNMSPGIVSLYQEIFTSTTKGESLQILIYPQKGNESWLDYGATQAGPKALISTMALNGITVKKIYNPVTGSVYMGPLVHNGNIYTIVLNGGAKEEDYKNAYTMLATFRVEN